MKSISKHFPFILVFGAILVASLYFANLYAVNNQKILSLQAKVTELSDTLSLTTASITSIKGSTSASIASAMQSLPKPQDELISLALDKATPSVVSINILKTASDKIGNGSGIIVKKDGYIITNNHVVDDPNANYSATLADGTEMTANVVYRNPSLDIAIIKIGGQDLATATLGNSDDVVVGQTVEAIGNALGEYSNSVSVGIISGLHRTIETSSASTINTQKVILNDAIQTDAAINPGNSGGPLVDLNGKVIGINVATVQGGNNISFAIPINTIKEIVSETKTVKPVYQ